MNRLASIILLTASLALPLIGRSQTTAPATQPAVPLTAIVPDGKPHRFEMRNKQFLIDGQPTLLIAGEMHFGRVLPEDFETRIRQAKAMGLNTLSFYLFWNRSEPREGVFDFTGVNDVRRMLKLCQDNGLWVLLRPGPYCCAEVDYGGIPWWTAKYPDVKIRTNDPKYVEWSRRYIEAVYKQVADFQVTKGGPLLMVQMENEYDMVARGNYDYPHALRAIFRDVGFEVPVFVCDPDSFPARDGSNPYGPDVLRGRNSLESERIYQEALAAAGDFPVFAPEVYTAWFSGWGQPIATRYATLPAIVNQTHFLLDRNVSWSYYMFFGGTNWGYSAGCNEWLPVQTSYNYSAPIDEAGRTTAKYRALRDLLARRTGRTLPEPPADPSVVALPDISLTRKLPLLATLPAQPAKTASRLLSMEELDQDYGFVLYRRRFPDGIKGKLELQQVMDYAITMVNGKSVGRTFIGYGSESAQIPLDASGPVTLDILVHNLGRISVITSARSQNRARKGLGGVLLNGQRLSDDWQIYCLPLAAVESLENASLEAAPVGPTFYQAAFHVASPASTFLDMRRWGMGVVWVNGHNLGRYWDRGGLRSLFVSSHFLKPGDNQITILELHDPPQNPSVAGVANIIEEPPVPFALRLDRMNPTSQPATMRR